MGAFTIIFIFWLLWLVQPDRYSLFEFSFETKIIITVVVIVVFIAAIIIFYPKMWVEDFKNLVREESKRAKHESKTPKRQRWEVENKMDYYKTLKRMLDQVEMGELKVEDEFKELLKSEIKKLDEEYYERHHHTPNFLIKREYHWEEKRDV